MGLFSVVIVMAHDCNNGAEGDIRPDIGQVRFDIQDHTDDPKTIFSVQSYLA